MLSHLLFFAKETTFVRIKNKAHYFVGKFILIFLENYIENTHLP